MIFWKDPTARALFLGSTRDGCSLQDAALVAGWDPEDTLRVVLQGTADRALGYKTQEARFVAEHEAAEGVHRRALANAAHVAATKGSITESVTVLANGQKTVRTTRRSPDGRLALDMLQLAHRERAVRAALAASLTTEGGGVLHALAAARAVAAHGDSDLMRLAQRLVQAEATAVEAVSADPTQRPPVHVTLVQKTGG